jgi:hypothetical protein
MAKKFLITFVLFSGFIFRVFSEGSQEILVPLLKLGAQIIDEAAADKKNNDFSYSSGSYVITITKDSDTQGYLEVNFPGLNISTTCWYRDTPIQKGSRYNGSATIMATKGHKSVFIFGRYFIHVGYRPEDSDGCIVIPRNEIERIYDYMKERNLLDQYIIQIVVR